MMTVNDDIVLRFDYDGRQNHLWQILGVLHESLRKIGGRLLVRLEVINVHELHSFDNTGMDIDKTAEMRHRIQLFALPIQEGLIKHRKVVRAAYREADDGGPVVARLRMPHGATALQCDSVHLLCDSGVVCVDPHPREPRHAMESPFRMDVLQSRHNMISPQRRRVPRPLQIRSFLQRGLEVFACKHCYRPRHHLRFQLRLFRNGWAHHGTDADSCARENLCPRCHQEDVNETVGHPLHELRAHTSGVPVGTCPEEHRLVHNNPRTRRSVFLDP
mmetsp:Transcript_36500/g.97190  ORF Transcript_36500/g.97190 Transcript_36500/m.97190 type:complete len:274 (-) Transcript_36500:727-1548(-)